MIDVIAPQAGNFLTHCYTNFKTGHWLSELFDSLQDVVRKEENCEAHMYFAVL